jgi:hypothetical protein
MTVVWDREPSCFKADIPVKKGNLLSVGIRLNDERGTAGPAHRRNTGFSFNKRHPETFTCCGDGSADACGACANDGYVKISVHDLTSFVRSMYCQKLTTVFMMQSITQQT